MDTKTIILLLIVVPYTFCAYQDQQYKQEPQPKQQHQPLYREPLYKQPPPRILSHKQAQSHDGGFKFAYTADNGLAHSEVIAPDGTRNGGYSYVDPHGKTISVKYTAGKDGFRILEGEHIPRETRPVQAAPAQQTQPLYSRMHQEEQINQRPSMFQTYQKPPVYQAPQMYQKTPVYQAPQMYQKPKILENYERPQPQFKPQFIPQPRSYSPPAQESASSNSVEESKEPDYHDEPGKPYSFGVGYAFQFGS